MKKIVLIGVCLLCGLTLFGCKPAETTDMTDIHDGNDTNGAVVTVRNEVEQADIWILPETEENLKTTLWGTATIAGLAVNEASRLSLDELGGPGVYLFRAIDTHEAFYAVNGIFLDADYSLRLTSDDSFTEAVLEIIDADGNVTDTCPAFEGVL